MEPENVGISTQTKINLNSVVVAYSNRGNPLEGKRPPRVGVPHYSLHLSALRFLSAFKSIGVRVEHIVRPEIFASDVSRKFVAPNGEDILHLAVGDFENLRLLKGAYNIAYVAWEYEAISTSMVEGDPVWKNQLWVLSRFDEIWVGCSFIKSVFEANGLQNIHVVPAPVPDYEGHARKLIEKIIGAQQTIPLSFDFSMPQSHNEARMSMLSSSFSEHYGSLSHSSKLRTYLTIVNPGDSRKNVEATILAFAQFAQRYPNNLLVVKLVSAAGEPLHEKVWRTLRHRINRLLGDGLVISKSILFVDGFLDEAELLDLVQAADFYISTSFAEGLNLPVLEAMSRSTVVISPIHTAMRDYLTAENCIECEANPILIDSYATTGYRAGMVTRNTVSIESVYRALELSRELTNSELDAIRRKAADAVRKKYDVSGVGALIMSRLQHVYSTLKENG